MSFVAWSLVSVVLVIVQGLLLQTACVAAGERSPSYTAALVTALIGTVAGAVATFVFGWSLGLVLHLFLGRTLAWIVGALLGFGVTAGIYRSRLLIPAGTAMRVAAIHLALSWAINALVWGVVTYGPF
jgi:hypothetical protein